MQPSDVNSTVIQDLLKLASDGQVEARDELIERVSIRLHRLTQRMLKNYPRLRRWEQTDDVFQNAVMRLHRSLAAVQPESARSFFALAATQIRRTLIDLARHHFGPDGHAAHHKSDVIQLPNEPAQASEPESLEGWVRFHEAVEKLPTDERNVFELTWYGEMKQIEIAELSGVSVRTVKRLWRKARMALGESLECETLVDKHPNKR